MTDQEVKETLAKMGITKWIKWKVRLENGFNDVIVIMMLLCMFAGIAAMGWKIFWVTLLIIILLEIIIVISKHMYCSIKIFFKNRK